MRFVRKWLAIVVLFGLPVLPAAADDNDVGRVKTAQTAPTDPTSEAEIETAAPPLLTTHPAIEQSRWAALLGMKAHTPRIPTFLSRPDPSVQDALLDLAHEHYAAGEYTEAHDRAVQATAADPGSLRCRLACELAIYAARRLDAGDEISRTRRIEALDRFAELFPHDFMTQDVLFESAGLLLLQGLIDEATPRLLQVVDLDPGTPTAASAADELVDTLSQQRQWAALSEATDALLAHDTLGTPRVRRDLRTARDRATFHLIEEEHVQAEDWEGAAEAFQQFSEEYPDSNLADRALYNAIVFYYKAGRSRVAANLANVLRRRFPSSPYIDRLQL